MSFDPTCLLSKKPLADVAKRPGAVACFYACRAEASRPAPLGAGALLAFDGLLDPGLQLILRQRADLGAGHLAVTEDHQGGDPPDSVLGGGHGIFVDVELRDLDLVAECRGNLFESRRDHLAGAAPFGPEVHDHRPLGLENVALEARVGHLGSTHLFPLRITCRARRRASQAESIGKGPGSVKAWTLWRGLLCTLCRAGGGLRRPHDDGCRGMVPIAAVRCRTKT